MIFAAASALSKARRVAMLLASMSWVACSGASEPARPTPRPAAAPRSAASISAAPAAPPSVVASPSASSPIGPSPSAASRVGRPMLLERHAGKPQPESYERPPLVTVTSQGALMAWTGSELQRRTPEGELVARLSFTSPSRGDVVVGSIAAEPGGGVLLLGHHTEGFTFGARVVPRASQFRQVFLAQASADLAPAWLTTTGGNGADVEASGLGVGPDGASLIVTQVYADSPNLRAGAISKNYDLVARRVSRQGKVEWAKSLGEGGNARVGAIAVDSQGVAFVSLQPSAFQYLGKLEAWTSRAQKKASADFRVGQLALDAMGRPLILSESAERVFELSALDDRLAVRWRKGLRASHAVMAVRPDGRIVLVGSGRELETEAFTIIDPDGAAFVAELSPEGKVLWFERLPPLALDGLSVALGPGDLAYLGHALGDHEIDARVAPGDGWGRVVSTVRLDP